MIAAHVLRLSLATSHALAIFAGIVPHEKIHGLEQRYAIVSGPSYVIVGRHGFDSYRRSRSCTSVEAKRYPRLGVLVHICNI
jgi:hypothetical protein